MSTHNQGSFVTRLLGAAAAAAGDWNEGNHTNIFLFTSIYQTPPSMSHCPWWPDRAESLKNLFKPPIFPQVAIKFIDKHIQ